MNATALLKKDHAAVKKLFQSYEKAGERKDRKQEIFQRIKGALDRHAQVEEEIFYPAVREASEERNDEETKDLVLEAQEEHNVVKTLLEEIEGMSPSDEEYDAKVTVLRENVEHHVGEEEGEMFPKAERQLGDRLEELGAEIAAREAALETPATTRLVNTVKTLIFGGSESSHAKSESSRRRRGVPKARAGRARGRVAKARSSAATQGGRARATSGSGGKVAAGKRAKQKRSGAQARTTAARRGGAVARAKASGSAAPTSGRRTRTKASAAKATSKMRSARAGKAAGGRGSRSGARASKARRLR